MCTYEVRFHVRDGIETACSASLGARTTEIHKTKYRLMSCDVTPRGHLIPSEGGGVGRLGGAKCKHDMKFNFITFLPLPPLSPPPGPPSARSPPSRTRAPPPCSCAVRPENPPARS